MKPGRSPNMNLEGVVATHWNEVPAKEIAYPGFSTRLLWSDSSGRKALMFEIAPGAVYPDLDVHAPGAEEVFVVSGDFCDGKNTYPAGPLFTTQLAARMSRSQKTAACCSCSFPKASLSS